MKRIFSVMVIFGLVYSSCTSEQPVVESTTSVSSDVLNKYAEKLGVNSNQLSSISLYNFIDDWYGTTYKYGGMTKAGVDCSGFCNLLYNDVYKKELPRMTRDIANVVNKVPKGDLEEGDLVLFNISGKANSHVGVYLINNYFVHASTSKGVIISSLENPYYKKTYNKGGKI